VRTFVLVHFHFKYETYRRNASSFVESGTSTTKFKSDWAEAVCSSLLLTTISDGCSGDLDTIVGRRQRRPLGLSRCVLRLNFPVFKKNASRFNIFRQLILIFVLSSWLISLAARGHSDELLVPVFAHHSQAFNASRSKLHLKLAIAVAFLNCNRVLRAHPILRLFSLRLIPSHSTP
jgi:hypothetical protein